MLWWHRIPIGNEEPPPCRSCYYPAMYVMPCMVFGFVREKKCICPVLPNRRAAASESNHHWVFIKSNTLWCSGVNEHIDNDGLVGPLRNSWNRFLYICYIHHAMTALRCRNLPFHGYIKKKKKKKKLFRCTRRETTNYIQTIVEMRKLTYSLHKIIETNMILCWQIVAYHPVGSNFWLILNGASPQQFKSRKCMATDGNSNGFYIMHDEFIKIFFP